MTNEQPFFQEMDAQETALLPQNFEQRLHLANGKVSCFFMKVMIQPHITQYAQNTFYLTSKSVWTLSH